MVYKIDIYNVEGEKVKSKQLNKEIFDDENLNEGLLHEAVLAHLSNARDNIAHTKNRAEVAGSGRKLYKQKGTGSARVGEARSPVRRHGGVAFGPRNVTNFKKSLNKKMKRVALISSLILKAKNKKIMGLDKFPYEDIKTKNASSALAKIGISGKSLLLILPETSEVVTKSFRNLKKAKVLTGNFMNPYDVLKYENVVFLGDSLEQLEETLKK